MQSSKVHLISDEEQDTVVLPAVKPQEQQVVANISMNLSPDGSTAIVRFNLFGAMEIALIIPEVVIRGFITQWKESLKQQQSIQNVLRDVRGNKLHGGN